MSTRVGSTFHASFKLHRARLAEVLELAHEVGAIRASDLSATSLGTNMWPAFLNWGRCTGLLIEAPQDVSKGSYDLTPFGRWCVEADSQLSSIGTMWLMHLHLVTASAAAPRYFAEVFFQHVISSFPTDIASVESTIAESLDTQIALKSLQTTAKVVLSSYSDPEALGPLGFLSKSGERSPVYSPSAYTASVSPTVFFACLMKWWEFEFGDVSTIPESSLQSDRGLGMILMLGSESTDALINALRRSQLLDVYRVAPPYQIVRHWESSAEATFEAFYGLMR